jgi:hypothetical protein
MLSTTIRVQVAGSVREYPADITAYGQHMAEGGRTVSLHEAQAQARNFFRANKDSAWLALNFWAALDSSGLAYHIEINRHGTYAITAAAPMPGPNNVQELYVA